MAVFAESTSPPIGPVNVPAVWWEQNEKAGSLPLYCVFPFADLTFGSGGLDLNLPNLFPPLHAKIKVTKTTPPFRPLKYLSSRSPPVFPLKAYAQRWHPKTVIFGNGLSALLVVHVPSYHGNWKTVSVRASIICREVAISKWIRKSLRVIQRQRILQAPSRSLFFMMKWSKTNKIS